MSKKFLGLVSCLLIAVVSYAQEDMKFVTMLSQPVGVFKQVDLTAGDVAVGQENAQMDQLIFCNKKSTACNIQANKVEIKNTHSFAGTSKPVPTGKEGTLELLGDASKLSTDSVPYFYVKDIQLQGTDFDTNDGSVAGTLTARDLKATVSAWGSSKVKILMMKNDSAKTMLDFQYTKNDVNSDIAVALDSMCIKGTTGEACSKVNFQANSIKDSSLDWRDNEQLKDKNGNLESTGTKFLTTSH